MSWPHPAYRIVTPRLVMRCYEPADAEALQIATAQSKAHLVPTMGWAKLEPTSVADKVELIRTFRGRFDLGQDFIYGIFDSTTNTLIGGTGLHPRRGPGVLEVGYWIHPDWVGQGLATEAAAAVVRVAFEVMGAHRVEIRIEQANHASLAVPPKLGFCREGMLRQACPYNADDNDFRDVVVFSLLDDEMPPTVPMKAFGAAGQDLLASKT